MTVWIVALLCLGLLAMEGYYQGAIRAAFSLLGIFFAILLAIPLSPIADWIFPLLGFDHPLVPRFFSPILAFFVVVALFKAGAEFVHRKVEYRYRYHVSDAERAVWQRMMQQVGLSLGIISGALYTVLICLVVSVFGYLTLQIGGDHSSSKMMRLINTLAADLQKTGMTKVVASLNPAPEIYFEVVDIFGLLYQNRLLEGRLESYPPFVVMAERPEWKAIGADKELQQDLQTEANVTKILENPKVQAVLTNLAIYNELVATDLKDLRAYLETGKSPKYDSEQILGRWAYDYPESFRLVRQNKERMASLAVSQFVRLKLELERRWEGSVLRATCDNKLAIQLPPNLEGTPVQGTNSPARLSLKGDWKRAGLGYRFTLADKNNKKYVCDATLVLPDHLLLNSLDGNFASFVKIAP